MIHHLIKLRCVEFYIEGIDQIYHRISLENDLLENLNFLNLEKLQALTSIAHIAQKFPNIITTNDLQMIQSGVYSGKILN